MIARSSALYTRAPEAMAVVAAVGLLTALLAALIALAQRDIKKVLVYSTVSQLGYMFLAVGVGAFAAGVFHLYTHAFFKALLFLGSGSVILALHHEQDLYRMGGLRKHLPLTWATMGIATLAIAGIPPFAGFFSKDEILWKSLTSDQGMFLFWLIGVIVAALTAFYMARLMFLTFHGGERFDLSRHDHGSHGAARGHERPRESSWLITGPLAVLAVLSGVAGLIGLPAWLGHNYFEEFLRPAFAHAYVGPYGDDHSHALEMGLAVLVVGLAAAAIYLAYRIFVSDPEIPGRLADRLAVLYRVLWNKFYVDEIYDAVVVWPLVRFSRFVLWRGVDVGLIDGAVNGTASLMRRWSDRVRRLQTGYARVYASWLLLGTVLIFVYYYLKS
jgi:NADH-quinone oxidoreductase subunit L